MTTVLTGQAWALVLKGITGHSAQRAELSTHLAGSDSVVSVMGKWGGLRYRLHAVLQMHLPHEGEVRCMA